MNSKETFLSLGEVDLDVEYLADGMNYFYLPHQLFLFCLTDLAFTNTLLSELKSGWKNGEYRKEFCKASPDNLEVKTIIEIMSNPLLWTSSLDLESKLEIIQAILILLTEVEASFKNSIYLELSVGSYPKRNVPMKVLAVSAEMANKELFQELKLVEWEEESIYFACIAERIKTQIMAMVSHSLVNLSIREAFILNKLNYEYSLNTNNPLVYFECSQELEALLMVALPERLANRNSFFYLGRFTEFSKEILSKEDAMEYIAHELSTEKREVTVKVFSDVFIINAQEK